MSITINIFECGVNLSRLDWNIGPISEQKLPRLKGETIMVTMTDTQQCPISISPVDKKGNPAPVQTVAFVSSDPAVLTVTQDTTNPLSAIVKAVASGAARVNVAADADMGDAVLNITGFLDFSISGGQAVGLTITPGAITEQV